MIYGTWEINNRYKPWIAVIIGIVLGVVVMYYNRAPGSVVGFKLIVEHILGGFMTGATATGMYEMTKTTKPGP